MTCHANKFSGTPEKQRDTADGLPDRNTLLTGERMTEKKKHKTRNRFYVPTAIFEDPINPTAVAVLTYLSSCCDVNRQCIVSQKRIAVKIGCSVSTVKRILQDLAKAGKIAIVPTRTETVNGKRRKDRNRYTVLIDPGYSSDRPGGMVQSGTEPAFRLSGEINTKDFLLKSASQIIPYKENEREIAEIFENCHTDCFPETGAAFENAIRKMYSSESITVRGETIPQCRVRECLRKLRVEHLDYVTERIQNAEKGITAGENYLISCIYNSVADMAVDNLRAFG